MVTSLERNALRVKRCWQSVQQSAETAPAPAAVDQERHRRRVLKKLLALKTEALRLYRPLPHLAELHSSRARWRIAHGSHRSSKTFSCAYEAAVAFCGCDPYDKYVPTNGNALVVCLDLDQVAMLWRKVAEPGAFKVIDDEITRLPRAVRYDPNNPLRLDPYDEAYREKWRDAPPLIPPRMLAAKPAWEDLAKGVPRYVKFITGWRVLFRSGEGRPPQGDHYHFGWLDEQIGNDLFIVELKRGLVALDEPPRWKPKAIWSATAQVTNPALTDMLYQAEQGSSNVAVFRALIADNPYVDAEEKQAYFESLPEEERATRYHGIPAIVGKYCYPQFDAQGIHGYEPKPIPADWCRYFWVDPGTQHCATLFFAVDPEERHVWVYDGFDARVEDVSEWAQRVAERLEGHFLEAAGIDGQAGKQNSYSTGETVADRYWRALLAAGVTPHQIGPLSGFLPGTKDVPAREEALRSWLTPRRHGQFQGLPVLRIARGVLGKLENQIRQACVAVSANGREVRQKLKKRPQDLLDDLEYAAHHGLPYYRPQQVQEEHGETVWDNFQQYERRRQSRQSADRRGRFGSTVEVG